MPTCTYPGAGCFPTSTPTDAGGTVHAAAHHASGTLPFTGADITTLVIIGILLVVLGAMFLYTRKHRDEPLASHGDHFTK